MIAQCAKNQGEFMKCLNCGVEIENDDNFCWKCGHWTAKGYLFLKNKNNVKMILNGDAIKQNNKFSVLFGLLGLGVILFTVMMIVRGNNLFKPFVYLKKQFTNYIYGYNTSIMKTDNKYSKENIKNYEDAIEIIKKDFEEQSWLCDKEIGISRIEYSLEENYYIPNVSFCDVSYTEASKLNDVIVKMYELFPNIQGALTNITVANATTSSEYIAYFQPLYQFVNINESIDLYNKVNKTQILLNSYYFLNGEMLAMPVESVVGDGWYVDGATWESTIAHELGHYISFVILLRENNLHDITFVNSSNYEQINNIVALFDNGKFSTDLVNEALNNYNIKYNTNMDINTFASTISKYASSKDDKGNLIADETIAEAVHDYYLHGNSMKPSSSEIIKVIKERLY